MDPRRFNRTASSRRVRVVQSGVSCRSCSVVFTGAEGLLGRLRERESETVSRVEDLTTMAHMEGSNPLAPTNSPKILGNLQSSVWRFTRFQRQM